MENAFYRIYRTTGIYKDPQLKVHPTVANMFSSTLLFESYKLPMLVPPMPWITPTNGGYYLTQSNLLRINNCFKEQRLLIDTIHPSKMNPTYDSLNILSACPWIINKPILDILIKVFNQNGSKELEVAQPASEGPQMPTPPE